MPTLATYIPIDQRYALAQGKTLPHHAQGAVLFADISGFTALTEALAQRFGQRRGADTLARQLNVVYNALIEPIHCHGGSVIGFSGDAITCWFDAMQIAQNAASVNGSDNGSDAANGSLRAITLAALDAAEGLQAAMQHFTALEIVPGVMLSLTLKVAVAAGSVRRFLVGDPQEQVVDVLAGTLLDRMAAAEGAAEKGEIILDADTAPLVEDAVHIDHWRTVDKRAFAVLPASNLRRESTPIIAPRPMVAAEIRLAEETMRPWVFPALYQRLQMGQERFVAELRPAAALFVKFGGLDYDNDEEAGRKLDDYIRWVQKILQRYEGSLIQVTTGDKGSYLYMAFGAPVAHDDNAERAVAAAVDLRQPPPHLDFIGNIQLGVSQGRMRVGAYGSETRRTYGVLGDATNLAARLMSHAEPGQILLSEPVADAVAHLYHLADMGRIAFKGKGEPQAVFAVEGWASQGNNGHHSLYAHELVGREAELARLTRLCTTVQQEGKGHILRLVGEAGIGKSHLANATCRLADQQELAVITASCQSTAQDNAYFALGQLLTQLLDVAEERPLTRQEHHSGIVQQVQSAVDRLHPNGSVLLPLLGDALNMPIPENDTTAAFDAELRQEALITLVLELVRARAQHQPLLLLLDDVHWLDEASQRVVVALARAVADMPVLLTLVHRPVTDESHGWLAAIRSLEYESPIELHELSNDGIAALVAHKLDGAITPLALSLVQALSQGNPFYTEELVEAMQDSGRLIKHEGVWTISPESVSALRNADCLASVNDAWTVRPHAPLSAVDLGIPDSVHGLVLSRLDRLPEPVKMTIKVASVIGRTFELELLSHSHPVRPAATELNGQLDLLLSRDFTRIEDGASHPRYLFKHNITQEVVYRTLLDDQRHELHATVAQSLEALRPDSTEQLAYHFHNSDLMQADVRAKALYYLGAAGEKSQREYANETALSYFDRALALETRWPWVKAKVEILHILGRREEEYEALAGAEEPPPLDRALLWGEYFDSVSDYDEATQAVEQGLALAREMDDDAGVARCHNRLGMIAWRQGEYAQAEEAYNQAREVARSNNLLQGEEAEACYGLGLVYRQQGRFDQAQIEFEMDLALNRQLSNRKNEARALNALGVVEFFKREYERALAYYQQSLEIRRTIGERAGVGGSMLSVAQVQSTMGDHAKAEPLLREAVNIYQQINDRWSEQIICNALGILYAAVGRYTEAETCLYRGLNISRDIGAEPVEAYILCNLGQVLREQYQIRNAESILSTGLAIAEEQGDLHLQAIYLNDLALVSLAMRSFALAIEQAQASMALYVKVDQPLASTASHTTIAQAYLELGNLPEALEHVQHTLEILDECQGEGPDYPHRDYWYCYLVLQEAGEDDRAKQALGQAYQLLVKQSQKISNEDMRRSYMDNIAVHRAIVEVAEQTVTLCC